MGSSKYVFLDLNFAHKEQKTINMTVSKKGLPFDLFKALLIEGLMIAEQT